MASTAQIISERLYEAGCRHAFGIPGGEILVLIDALESAGLKFILTKHENSAGFMAEGTHHFTGAPCILIATVGPGVANAVNVITNCLQDQVPLIFLTGCIDPDVSHTYTHQIFDHGKLLAPITKASFTAVDGAIDVIIDKAISIALDDKPGPVHIDVPISLAHKEQKNTAKTRRVKPALVGPAPSRDLEAARHVFSKAKKPIIIAGIDVLHHNAAPVLRNFVKNYSIPTITTYKAKGVLPEDHPCAMGGAGLSPKADSILQEILKQSDLVILIGYDPIEMRLNWRFPWDLDKQVIEFSATPNLHYVHQAKYSFVGCIGSGILALTSKLNPHTIWPQKEYLEVRKTHKMAFLSETSWGPTAIIKGARRALPKHGIATVDTGAHRIFLSQAWECYEPRSLLQSTGLCTMGVALPLAIGRKIAEPQRPLIAFSGDAGLEMILGELAMLRDLKLAIPIIVFVDAQLALIEMKQRSSQLKTSGVKFGTTDFPGVAEALGGVGITVQSERELENAIKEAFKRDTYSIIACPLPNHNYDEKI